MDKNTYASYEFLPANSTDTDAGQFFVVQDDGTFLINRQVQYVTQVQDVKQVLDNVAPSTVYNIPTQQFFVDVDNSTELISVSDQFILPDADNGLYNNSFLLQPTSSTTVEHMDEDVSVDQYKETNVQELDIDVDVVTLNAKQTNNFTEITLSDEQYQTLEHKGWILLESNDKIFVLNTLGLHDITANDKLIERLKNEIQSTTSGLDAGCVKIDSAESEFATIAAQSSTDHEPILEIRNEFVMNDNDEQEENSAAKGLQFVAEGKEAIQLEVEKQHYTEVPVLEAEPQNKLTEPVTPKSKTISAKSLKIKTKLRFKDIPNKIILGKTVDGKQLIANVIKRKLPANARVKNESQNCMKVDYEDVTGRPETQLHNITGLTESGFLSLIQQSARGRKKELFTQEDVATADTVITELLNVPEMKESLIGQNLIITKVSSNKDEYGVLHNKSKPVLVTGRAIPKLDGYDFKHMPNLLRGIKLGQDQNAEHNESVDHDLLEENKNFSIFHIHITETKCTDNVVRAAVTLNKRQLPLSLVFDLKKRYPSAVYACSACATTFKTEAALKEHREIQCSDVDDMLTKDTDVGITCTISDKGKEKVFTCTVCDTKFSNLNNCHRHVRTHTAPKRQEKETEKSDNSTTEDESGNEVYRCKMCPSIYFYPSSLSKHIVSKHINVKSNK